MLLTPEEVSKILRLSKQTLYNRRMRELAPAFIKIGKKVFYDSKDVDKFIEDTKWGGDYGQSY